MAPIQPPPLPELDVAKCLSGEQQLISWSAAYVALCDPETASKSVALLSFLRDPANLEALSKPWQPFLPASKTERNKFEGKIAPINVAPNSEAGYSLDEIKDDSLWLSKLANISEDAALRLVLLEWQNRPSAQILSGLTEEEALSVHDAAGLSNLSASTFVPNSSIVTSPSGASNNLFDNTDQRKLRILDAYLSARIAIVRISQLLVSWGSTPRLRESYGRDYRICNDWFEALGKEIATRQRGKGQDSEALDQCIQAVEERWNTVDEGFTWDVAENIQEAVVQLWLTAYVTEIVHLMHLAILHTDLLSEKFVAAPTVERWFTSVSARDFYRNLVLPFEGQQHLVSLLQMLTSLLCLAILKVNVVVSDLQTGESDSWDPSCYLLNTSLLETVSNIFGMAKALGPSAATPPAFAWSTILWRISARATEMEQQRDDQLQSSTGGPASALSKLEEAALSIARLDGSEIFDGKVSYRDLAETGSQFGVLDIVTQLLSLGMSFYGTDVDRVSRDQFRFLFLHLVRSSLQSLIVEYTPELIICTHAIMTGDRSFRRWTHDSSARHVDPITAFCLQDSDVLRPLLIDEAYLRYPYELIPSLKFSSALTRGERPTDDRLPVTAEVLTNMRTLMQRLPLDFTAYSSIREDENANWVLLSEDLPQFSRKPASSFGGMQKMLTSSSHALDDDSLVIPASTEGNIVDDRERPFVAVWHYPHSALEYLGQLLSTYVLRSDKVEFSSQEPVPLEGAIEIIGFFADLLHSSLRDDANIVSQELLSVLGITANRGQDTVALVLAIFEQGLLFQEENPGNPDSLELLVNCVRFLQALVLIAPHRVWPWLTRSRLLDTDGSGGGLATVLIGTEMVLGHYDFLIGCIHLFQSLVEDAVGKTVARRVSSKAVTRFNEAPASESGTSHKVMSNILLAFGKNLASIHEGSLNFRYTRLEDRLEINIGICEVFNKIMDYVYGVDDNSNLSSKLTGMLSPICEYLTSIYLSESENDLPTNPILATILSGATTENSTFLTHSTALWQQQTCKALCFANALVRIAMLLDRPWTHLEQQLFKATPLLARLYASNDVYTSPVVVLLESLVRGAVRPNGASLSASHRAGKSGQAEPPSLLGHLGPRTAKNFLSILSRLDEPLGVVDIQTQVWNLLSAVVTCKQQWFSLYLLTGKTPRESLRDRTKQGHTRNKALLTRAIDSLAQLNIDKAQNDWRLYTSMLEFVSCAQNNWAWAMGGVKQHKDFIRKLIAFLKWLPSKQTDLNTVEGATIRSYLNTFAALACEVLAIHLHLSLQAGDVSPLKEIVPCLTYMEDNALRKPSYNASLHANLKKNFEAQYQAISLASFKRTTLYPVEFGPRFFYDIELGDKVLQFNNQWRHRKGYRSEVVRTNLNLGVVESEIHLLKSWRYLVLELGNAVGKDEAVSRVLVKVVKNCMKTNAEAALPEALFGQLTALRADLAFVVLQRMVNAKTSYSEVRQLVEPVWHAIRSATADFDTIFSGAAVDYYRSLLRILYLALQFHLVDESASNEDVSLRASFRGSMPANHKTLVKPMSHMLLEVLSEAVAKGFRSLATQLHSAPETVFPSDFALLTAILQTILSVPEMTTWHAQAALLFANSNTLRYATSLFSWADRITIPTNGVNDPIYGELSILFILSLSSMQPLAESMAVEGILAQLNSANLMNYFRRPGGMSPFDSPARLFAIWSKGILPLCLNLLRAVGPAIAGEISAFLNQFPEQLNRASNCLNSRTVKKITLSLASETHSLALISSILENDRANSARLGIQAGDIPALEWDRDVVKEDIDTWMGRRSALLDKVVVLDERDAALFAKKVNAATAGEGENMLEQRVLRELEAAGECLDLGKGNGNGS